MKATVTMDGIWNFLSSLSLSSRNKRWLAERLIESDQIDAIKLQQEREISLIRDSMERAWSEVRESERTAKPMPCIDDLISELQMTLWKSLY